MDADSEQMVTEALDSAIVDVAEEEFGRLSKGLSDQEVAARIDGALRSLREISRVKPTYDDWVALFYCLWFQPGQVNLAYSLACRLLEHQGPTILRGKGILRVLDFGCGALAMQFGLKLVSMDQVQRFGSTPIMDCRGEDESGPMKAIGSLVYRRFEQATDSLGPNYAAGDVDMEWVTALHVAYSESANVVESALDSVIHKRRPDLVLVTKNRSNGARMYSPTEQLYAEMPEARLQSGKLDNAGGGVFEKVTDFRRSLAKKYPGLAEHALLSRWETTWSNQITKSFNRYYVRRRAR